MVLVQNDAHKIDVCFVVLRCVVYLFIMYVCVYRLFCKQNANVYSKMYIV